MHTDKIRDLIESLGEILQEDMENNYNKLSNVLMSISKPEINEEIDTITGSLVKLVEQIQYMGKELNKFNSKLNRIEKSINDSSTNITSTQVESSVDTSINSVESNKTMLKGFYNSDIGKAFTDSKFTTDDSQVIEEIVENNNPSEVSLNENNGLDGKSALDDPRFANLFKKKK